MTDDTAEAAQAADAPIAVTEQQVARVRQLFASAPAADEADESDAAPAFQFARWTRPVCPRVIGLDTASAERVLAALASAAEICGVKLCAEGGSVGADQAEPATPKAWTGRSCSGP